MYFGIYCYLIKFVFFSNEKVNIIKKFKEIHFISLNFVNENTIEKNVEAFKFY